MKALVLLALLAGTSGSYGQGIAVAASVRQTTAQPAKTIDIALKSVSLRDAVRQVINLSGVNVLYSPEVFEGTAKVTYRASGVTAREALEGILKGTNLSVAQSSLGGLKIDRLSAQQARINGVITGKVTDSRSGKGISGASVSAASGRSTISDDGGSYRLVGVASGTQTITVRLVGYAKQIRSVTVAEGATVSADFKMEPSTNVLDQVVVTGTATATELKAVPSAITVITAKQIEERGITKIDQLFRGDVPGLFALNRGSQSALDEVIMYSRGASALVDQGNGGSAGTEFNTNTIKTYIDGVEVADSKYMSQIDPGSIERIEILSGPQASTIYGANAINGVMQIFTKRGTTNRPQLAINLASGIAQNRITSNVAPNHLADAKISGLEGRVSYNIGGSWNYIGSWTPAKQTQRITGNGGARMEWGKVTTDVSARQGQTRNRVSGSSSQTSTDLRSNGIWNFEPNTILVRPTLRILNGRTFGATLGYRATSWWAHEFVVGSDQSESVNMGTVPGYFSGTGGGDTSLNLSSSITARASQSYNTTLNIHLSSFSRLNLTLGADHWRTSGSSLSGAGLSLTGTLGSPSVTRNPAAKNIGSYVQGQWALWDALFVTYGVRADWNPNYGDDAKVAPGRYGASYTKDFETPLGEVSAKLRGSYGRSIRPPSPGLALTIPAAQAQSAAAVAQFGNYDFRIANPELGPEFQQGGEGGIEMYLGNRGSVVVTRFNQTVDNLISQIIRFDSTRSLTPVFPSTANCARDVTFTFFLFDADGYCYAFQQKYLNVGSIRNQGWELQGSVNTGPFTTRGTYSWVKSRVIGITPRYKSILTGSQFQKGRPFDLLPEHTWALGVTYAQARSTVALSVNGIGMRFNSGSGTANALFLEASNNNRFQISRPRMDLSSANYRAILAGYATADLNATHRFSSRIDALLNVTNLTDFYTNDLSADFASLGRQTKVGFRWRTN